MLESAFTGGIRPAWFVADEVYGNDSSLWWWLEKIAKQPYILTVSKKQSVVIGWQRYQAQELLPLLAVREKDTMTGRKCQLIVTDRMVSNVGYCSAAL